MQQAYMGLRLAMRLQTSGVEQRGGELASLVEQRMAVGVPVEVHVRTANTRVALDDAPDGDKG